MLSIKTRWPELANNAKNIIIICLVIVLVVSVVWIIRLYTDQAKYIKRISDAQKTSSGIENINSEIRRELQTARERVSGLEERLRERQERDIRIENILGKLREAYKQTEGTVSDIESTIVRLEKLFDILFSIGDID